MPPRKRYCGQLDSYDDQEGYHVTYDDGDQELLGEVDGRDDVRLIGTAADEVHISTLE